VQSQTEVHSASRQRFGQLLERPEDQIDLAECALLIACEEYPDLELQHYRSRLDDLGREARARVAAGQGLAGRVQLLARFMAEELEFKGNAEHYYDPRNSYLNEVLTRRLGIPISLSAVYIEVGRRAGLDVRGIGLPGHFIVQVAEGHEQALIDPFHGGAILSMDDCQRRLDRIFDGRLRLDRSMLQPAGTRQILARMLYNLKGIHVQAQDHLRALAIVELLLLVEPQSLDELRDRALLYAALDCFGLAVRDLTLFLERSPRAPDAAELRSTLLTLRARQARVN